MLRRIALLAVALTLAVAPAAWADGDPASDILPAEDVYYPYMPAPSGPLVKTLNALLKEVRKKGYPVKVALIASVGDLGAYPQLFNNPQEYANLLASELPTNPHGKVTDKLHLLVVMPGGFGGKDLGDRVDEALSPVAIDAEAASDGLARAAIEAVARIATVNGFPTEIPEVPAAGREGSGEATPVVWALVAFPFLVLGVGLLLQQRRRRSSDARPLPEAEAQAGDAPTRST